MYLREITVEPQAGTAPWSSTGWEDRKHWLPGCMECRDDDDDDDDGDDGIHPK